MLLPALGLEARRPQSLTVLWGHSPVALSTEAGVAVDFVHTLGPVLAAVVPAVILVLTAAVTCITWCTLTPGRRMGLGGMGGGMNRSWGQTGEGED